MAQAAPEAPPTTEDAEKAKLKAAQCARRWIAELTQSEKAQQKWLTRSRKIVRLYKQEHRNDADQRRFAMLWSNTQTILPAVYSRPPQPVVSRRFSDADPIAREASEVLERALAFSVDAQDLDGVLGQSAFDFVLLARGQTWERYVPTTGPQVTPQIELQVKTEGDDSEDPSYTDEDGNDYEGEVQTGEDGKTYGFGQPYAPVIYEESVTDYVNWEDFGTSVARTWDEVDYVWRRVYLNRDQLTDRFGEDLGKRIPLDWSPRNKGANPEANDLVNKAAVYEIWCKSEKKVYWISRAFNEAPLDERDDLLGLDGFFPCPRPLLGTTANDSTIPLPDYVFYQDQAEEIDKLTARIAHLQDALKVRGFYAGDIKTNLNNLLNSDNNIMIPVADWAGLKEDGGVAGKIEWFPIAQVVEALNALIQQRTQLINDVYQITGVADILRGMGDPRATATQEQLKGQWGTLRVRDRQTEIMRFARDILRIKGQVIAEKFEPETLKAMTGLKLPTNADKQQAMAQIQQLQMQAQQQALLAQAAQAQQPPPQAQPMPGQPAPMAGPPGAPPQAPAAPPQAPPSPMMGHNGGPPMALPPIPEELQDILESPSWEDVVGLLRDNAMRMFRIDIETDSTIEPNEQEEKARTTELLQALGNLVQQWGPAIAAQPALAPMVGEMIKFALRRFRAGRQLEEIIDSTIDKLVKQAGSAPPPSAPQQAPIDQTKVAVASINQQTAALEQQGETERENIRAEVQQQKVGVQGALAQAKIVALSRDTTPQGIA